MTEDHDMELVRDFNDGTSWWASCSCGWEANTPCRTEAQAADRWENHCDVWGQHLPGVHRDTTAGTPTAVANMAMTVIRKNVQRIEPRRTHSDTPPSLSDGDHFDSGRTDA